MPKGGTHAIPRGVPGDGRRGRQTLSRIVGTLATAVRVDRAHAIGYKLKKYPACIDMLAGVCISSDAPGFDSRAMVLRCRAFSEHLNFRLDNAAASAGRALQEVAPMGEEGRTS